MSLRRKLLAFLHNRKKTTEYTELAYLESTGTQWIDVGIAFQPIKAVIEVCFNSEKATRQAMGFSSNNTTYFAKTSGGVFELGGGVTLDNSNAYQWQEVIFEHNGVAGVNNGSVGKITVGGKSISRSGTPNRPTTNFCLFNIPGYGTTLVCYCKISSAKFYNANDELIADLIPVLDKDFTPCMYDKVSGTYLYNVGTGEFNWKLPNQLEYLESDGNQYLLTDYYPNSNTAVEVDYFPSPSSVFNCIYGTQSSINSNRFYALISSTNYKIQISSLKSGNYYGLDGVGGLMYNDQSFTRSQIRVVLTVDNYNKLIRTVTDDGTVDYDMTSFDGLGQVDCVYPLVIFNRGTAGVVNQTNGYKGRMYSYKIWESDKLVHYYIPVFDEDLTPCMYDLVSKQYLRNQGTGAFKGYFADGSRLVSYLESDGNQYLNIGIIPNDKIGVKAKFYVNSASGKNYVVGSRGNGVERFYLYSTESSAYVKYGYDAFYTTNITPVVGTPVEASLNYLNDRKYIYNGTEVNSNLPQTDFSDNTYDMYLFSSNFANVFYNDAILNGRIYYCQITQSNKVAMYLIPVLDSSNTACMYDVVTEKLFVNQGSGSFTYE